MITDINSEDRLVQRTFAQHLEKVLGWESVYAYTNETFGPQGMLGRSSERDVVLVRDLRAAAERLNHDLPASVVDQVVEKLTHIDFARSLLQHNREFYGFIREGVPVEWRDTEYLAGTFFSYLRYFSSECFRRQASKLQGGANVIAWYWSWAFLHFLPWKSGTRLADVLRYY
jgi:hypothetical protein